jgi:hypothetical protein
MSGTLVRDCWMTYGGTGEKIPSTIRSLHPSRKGGVHSITDQHAGGGTCRDLLLNRVPMAARVKCPIIEGHVDQGQQGCSGVSATAGEGGGSCGLGKSFHRVPTNPAAPPLWLRLWIQAACRLRHTSTSQTLS